LVQQYAHCSDASARSKRAAGASLSSRDCIQVWSEVVGSSCSTRLQLPHVQLPIHPDPELPAAQDTTSCTTVCLSPAMLCCPVLSCAVLCCPVLRYPLLCCAGLQFHFGDVVFGVYQLALHHSTVNAMDTVKGHTVQDAQLIAFLLEVCVLSVCLCVCRAPAAGHKQQQRAMGCVCYRGSTHKPAPAESLNHCSHCLYHCLATGHRCCQRSLLRCQG
jgi:hypothetical protein